MQRKEKFLNKKNVLTDINLLLLMLNKNKGKNLLKPKLGEKIMLKQNAKNLLMLKSL